jgi:hypothetical protein
MAQRKIIKWKERKSMLSWEGTVKGDNEPLIFIEGGLCVTDLRESRKSKVCISPKHYKIIGLTLDEAKQLAEDLVTGENFEKHEKNRQIWIAEGERTVKLIAEAEALIKKLKAVK